MKQDTVNTQDNSIVLTFKATREKLDWQGNVIEDVEIYIYTWDNYDPKVFLESVIHKGDLSCVPNLADRKSPIEFMRSINNDFARYEDYSSGLKRYKTIESEPFNGIKFVVYNRSNDTNMKWVME